MLRARRDPHGAGLVYMGTIDSMNTVRYATMLETRNTTWSKSTGGGVEDAEPAGGTGGQVQFTGGESGGPGRHVGVLRDGQILPSASINQTTIQGGYDQQIRARRKTRFEPGQAHFYGGDLEFTALLTVTFVPSRLLNTAFANVPHYIASAVQNAGHQRAPDARFRPSRERLPGLPPASLREKAAATAQGVRDYFSRDVAKIDKIYLKERTIIPHNQIHAEVIPSGSPGDVAVEEVPRGFVPDRPLNVTPEDITDHEILALGWDHEKLQVFFDELLAKLAGNERPVSNERSFAVERLLEHGTRSRQALHNILSYAIFTGQIDRLVSGTGMRMPTLVREGGLVTDNHGWVTVRVRFADPELMGWFDGWVESVNYNFNEYQEYMNRQFGMSLSLEGGGEVNTGNLSGTLSPVSPARRTVGGLVNASVGSTNTKKSSSTQQVMKRYDAVNIAVPRLRASVDAIVEVKAEAENRRDKLHVPHCPGSAAARSPPCTGSGPRPSLVTLPSPP